MSSEKKLMAKCLDAKSYDGHLTVGKVYEVEETSSGTFYKFKSDSGKTAEAYQTRFEIVSGASELPKPTIPLTTEFKVGDEVKIRKDSDYYGRDTTNPADKVGVVIHAELSQYIGDLCIRVEWSKGMTNVYEPEDLEHAEQPATIPEPEPEIPSKWANVEIGYY